MKKVWGFKSHKTRLIFWLLVLTLVPLSIVSMHGYMERVAALKEDAFEKLEVIRDLKCERVEHFLEEMIQDTKIISNDAEIRAVEKIYKKAELDQEDRNILRMIEKILSHYAENYDRYIELFIINPVSGRVEISTNKAMVGTDKSEDPYFTEPMETHRTYIKDIYYSESVQRFTMAISHPIYCLKHGEHIVGFLVARIDLEKSFYEILMDPSGMGETGEILLVNKEGLALNPLKGYENPQLRLKVETESAIRSSKGKTGVIEARDYRGKEALAAYTQIPMTGWGLIVKQDLKEVYGRINVIFQTFLMIYLVALLLVYIISISLGKKISKPVIEMVQVSKRLEGGDLSARNTISSSDELGSLAESFNNMADSINSQINIQKGIGEIIEKMVSAGGLKESCFEVLKKLVDITGSNLGAFYIYNKGSKRFEHFCSLGMNPELLEPFDASKLEGEFAEALIYKRISCIKDIPEDTPFKFRTFAGTALPKEFITVPVLAKEDVQAVICMASLNGYLKEGIETLNQAWMSINTAFSNLLANEETKKLAEELNEKNTVLQTLADELHQQSEELQEQNMELDVQRRQVEEADRLKSEFLSNMSHELRTPLNSIMALSRVLIMQAGAKLSEEEGGYLEIIERNGKKLLALINDILDLSKIEAGRVDVSIKPVSLAIQVNMIADSLDAIAKEKGIRIVRDVPADIPSIQSDEQRVYQIFQNVVGNAVKFTEKGEVTISGYADEKNIHIQVKDTGIGISEDQVSHIFEEFRQADGSSSRKYEGTGLGLAIASKSAKILGGNITVESVQGKGSLFTVILPIEWHGTDSVNKSIWEEFSSESRNGDDYSMTSKGKAKTKISGDKKKDVFPETEHITKILKTGKRRKKILLIEDSEEAVIQVKAVLEREGYYILKARGGREAFELIRHAIPDGIILDLMMPGMDGFEVLERLRGAEATANIPVLILTAKDLSPEDIKRLSAGNVQWLIRKGDVDIEGLVRKTRSMLGETQKTEKSILSDKCKRAKKPIIKKERGTKSGRPKILVVEDNPDNMITVKAILKERYEVLEAMDGEEGLKKAVDGDPDLLLLDMSLPKMDGYEVARRIKDDKRSAHIPVIALTARAMKGDRENAMDAGCDDYISKPIDPEVFLKKIEQFLSVLAKV